MNYCLRRINEREEKGAVENMEGGEKLLLREKGPLALADSNV